MQAVLILVIGPVTPVHVKVFYIDKLPVSHRHGISPLVCDGNALHPEMLHPVELHGENHVGEDVHLGPEMMHLGGRIVIVDTSDQGNVPVLDIYRVQVGV